MQRRIILAYLLLMLHKVHALLFVPLLGHALLTTLGPRHEMIPHVYATNEGKKLDVPNNIYPTTIPKSLDEQHVEDRNENFMDLKYQHPPLKNFHEHQHNESQQLGIFHKFPTSTTTNLPTRPLKPQTKNRTVFCCEPEAFQHFYITSDLKHPQPMTNAWKRARAGERATTRYLCLLSNGLPITRACFFNATLGAAKWENITHWPNISCLHRTRQRIATIELNQLQEELLNGTYRERGAPGRREVLRKMGTIMQNPDYQILPADVHYMANILRETVDQSSDAELSQDMVGICSHLMAQDPAVLRLSGEVNATNFLLETFEQYMDDMCSTVGYNQSCAGTSIFGEVSQNNSSKSRLQEGIETVDYPRLGIRAYLSQNISVYYVDPQCAQISGIAVFDSSLTSNATDRALFREARGDFLYRFIHWHESAADILNEPGLQVATFVPFTLWTTVSSELLLLGSTPMIVLKVYATDCLFVERETLIYRKPSSKILSISIPGHTGALSESLPFMLRNEHFNSQLPATQTVGTGCGYWNYSTWVSAGVQTSLDALRHPVILCGSLHLTQFSFLVGGSYRQDDPFDAVLITPQHRRVLDIISLLGCSLSLAGLLGIWLTAALFRSWRSLASNKVLLNLCSVLTLQLVLFVFVNTNDVTQDLLEHHYYVDCVVLGALMQYTILVLFSWMLIVAFMQFQRYVTVIGIVRPKHYILKSALAAWCFPLIPTILVVSIDPQSYVPTEYQIRNTGAVCYPSGHGLAFGVILPIALIVIANLTIFVYVFYSITHSLKQSMLRSERKMLKKQIRLSVLLFFLLGLSWIFGIFAFMQAGIVFSYLFCLTATLQGFVLFIYFVVLDEVSRRLWRKLLFGESAAKKDIDVRSKEMQSMTASTGLSGQEQETGSQNQQALENERVGLNKM